MDTRTLIESRYGDQVRAFEQSQAWQCLVTGTADTHTYDRFIAKLCEAHLKSPQILAFLFAIAPPAVAADLQHNLLEEMGLDDEGVCHPDLLYRLATAAGLDQTQQAALTRVAEDQLRRLVSEPLMFGTLQELGLSVLLEVTSFEWMLSRLAGRLGQALETYRGLSPEDLAWFYHHSEVDIRHAEEGVAAVVQYVEYYDFDPEDIEAILDITFRENVFIKRYFGAIALATETHMLEAL